MRVYEGGCHCGKVRFRAELDLASMSECNCSICTKKGFLYLIVPLERFTVLQGQDELTTYQFGTGVAKHTFCRNCGIHAFYVPRSDPDKVSVNARCLDGIRPEDLHSSHLFDGQHWEQAMETRRAAEAN